MESIMEQINIATSRVGCVSKIGIHFNLKLCQFKPGVNKELFDEPTIILTLA